MHRELEPAPERGVLRYPSRAREGRPQCDATLARLAAVASGWAEERQWRVPVARHGRHGDRVPAALGVQSMTKVKLPWLYRRRLEASVRTICRANDERAGFEALEHLPPVQGDLPGVTPGGIIFAACDDGYFYKYAQHFARTALERSPDQSLHLHVYNPRPPDLRGHDGSFILVVWTSHHIVGACELESLLDPG